ISDIVVRDPRRSVFFADQINAVKFDRRSQRVADCATQQTAGEMLLCSHNFLFPSYDIIDGPKFRENQSGRQSVFLQHKGSKGQRIEAKLSSGSQVTEAE